ncbi:hypothetical protein ACLOJK_041930 [Asimina triloba]
MEEECKFPEEIVEEILYRLPKKSLARFSKGKGNANLECSKLSSMGQDYVLIDSWNGFLLFRNRPPAQRQEQCKVYHPATDRSWHITSPASTNLRFSLAPDAHAHHFKLVRIFKTRIDFKKSIGSQVYSSYNEEWGKEPLPSFPLPNPYVGIDWERSVFVKGASHWIWFNYLVIYRLEDGDCEFVKLPRVPGRRESQNRCIWDSEGCLNYCNVYRTSSIGIWSLHNSIGNKYSFRWKLEHKGTITPPFPFKPIAHNDDFSIVYLEYDRKIFSYNLVTKELKEACISPFADSDYWALPFLYLSQSDIAAIVMRDGEPSNPCLVEMRKRRLCTTTTIIEAQLLSKLTHLMEATINACLAPLVAEIDKLNASLAQLEAKIDNLTQSQPQSQPQTQSPTQPEPEPQP